MPADASRQSNAPPRALLGARAAGPRPRLPGLLDHQHLDAEGRQEHHPHRRHLRSAGNLRRGPPGRRSSRLLRRPGDDPGLQRPAVLQLSRRLPQHDPGADRKLRPARRRKAALPALLEQPKIRPSSASTAPRPRPNRATAGSTPTSSSATRRKPNVSLPTTSRNSSTPIAGGVEELNAPEWEAALEEDGQSDGPIAARLKGYEELGSKLGIRTGQAAIVTGPRGTETLQDGPSLAEIEAAIARRRIALRQLGGGVSARGGRARRPTSSRRSAPGRWSRGIPRGSRPGPPGLRCWGSGRPRKGLEAAVGDRFAASTPWAIGIVRSRSPQTIRVGMSPSR